MNLIIPMAGRGKRMRPHTIVTPKPLLPIAGKPIVERLVEDIATLNNREIHEIGFVINPDFGSEVEEMLDEIAGKVNAKCRIYYQEQALGTAHAVLCAAESLEGPATVAFADTLFRANFTIDPEVDATIWVKQVDDPSAFGVVNTDTAGDIINFVEKPKEPVSDLAIIGIYYFKDSGVLKKELQKLIDQKIMDGGEYQLTRVLSNLKNSGLRFRPGKVDEWLDCGNKNATVDSNKRYLEFIKDTNLVHENAKLENSVILPPVYVDKNAEIKNSVVGPHVSIGKNAKINNSCIKNSILQSDCLVENAIFENSMVGKHAKISGKPVDLSMGDYSTINL